MRRKMKKKIDQKKINDAISMFMNSIINESKSPLLTIFEQYFDPLYVYGDSIDFDLNYDNLNIIYDVLNREMFENKLKLGQTTNIFLYCESESTINSIAKQEYEVDNTFNAHDYLAVYLPKQKFFRYPINNKLGMISTKNGIFINIDSGHKVAFPYLLTTLFHEMLHCYDGLYGTLFPFTALLLEKGYKVSEISWKSHFTPTFNQKAKNMMKKHGLSILLSGNDENFEELNRQAANEAKMLKEIDISNYISVDIFKEFESQIDNHAYKCKDGSAIITYS